jgi:hypothetical protein
MTAFGKLCCVVVLYFTVVYAPYSSAQSAGTAESSPAFDRAQHLRRGINLSEWFAQVYDKRGYTREH